MTCPAPETDAPERGLPDRALMAGNRREPLWVHGSLSAPLAGRIGRRRARMITRGFDASKEEHGPPPQRD